MPPDTNEATTGTQEEVTRNRVKHPSRSGLVLLALFLVAIHASWAIHHYQFQSLPVPLTADQAGKRGFSEEEAMKHVKALTQLGPRPVGSEGLDLALQYVLAVSEKIKKMAHWEVDVQLDFFHAKTGANRLVSGLFTGKTLVYSDLNHIILRILPKHASEAEENAILVSSHIDTVFSTEGAGDCSSCVAVMLELARGISHWAHGFKNSVIFLFNVGEEDGLNGAHSFITQHPWSSTIRMAIDLEAMGVGGKSSIFQAGPHPWAIENFSKVAKYPSGQILSQDIFLSGVIKSATDFQVYREVSGISGLDFAYVDNSAVYHTKNDKLKLLKPGSIQHLGENMLAFLLHTAVSQLPNDKEMEADGKDPAIYFDILGTYMIVYRQSFAAMLHNSVILQTLLIWATSLLMGGYPAIVTLGFSLVTMALMWFFSISFSIIVAFVLPFITSSPVPYVASPWLIVGLFAAPAVLGALTGQHLGFLILQRYLLHSYSKRNLQQSLVAQTDKIKLEAERWLYKAGFVQWFILLMIGSYYKIGSSYLALVWLVSPAFSYGLLEATLTPARSPKPLKIVTLLLGLSVPILMSASIFIQLVGTLIGGVVRFDRNPGSSPEWLGNIIVATVIAIIVCLTTVYLLSYVHLSGAKQSLILAACILFGLSVIATICIPPFTEDTARAVNVVHVVDAMGNYGKDKDPISYISLFSTTPGSLINEAEEIKEGFVCGRDKVIDFVTFSVKYGCWSYNDSGSGWSYSEIPMLRVVREIKRDVRVTEILVDVKTSSRWSLAINALEIEDFILKVAGNTEQLVPHGNKNSVDGWHIIQFAGGKNSPTKFNLTLIWLKNSSGLSSNTDEKKDNQRSLLKLRTDLNRLTPKTERILRKLPHWCSLFGKSTSPFTLAFLSSLPVSI